MVVFIYIYICFVFLMLSGKWAVTQMSVRARDEASVGSLPVAYLLFPISISSPQRDKLLHFKS